MLRKRCSSTHRQQVELREGTGLRIEFRHGGIRKSSASRIDAATRRLMAPQETDTTAWSYYIFHAKGYSLVWLRSCLRK